MLPLDFVSDTRRVSLGRGCMLLVVQSRKIGEREKEREQWVATIEVYRNYLKALVDEIGKLCQQ